MSAVPGPTARVVVPGIVCRIVVDTAHFKYNASAEVELCGSAQDPFPAGDAPDWLPLLGRTRLQPDTRHEFTSQRAQPVATVRLDAFPDGGLSRVRSIASIDAQARRAAGFRSFHSLLTAGRALLVGTGIQPEAAAEIAGQRPLPEGWPSDQRGPAGHGAGHRTLLGMIEGSSR